ncbi:AraC family transcriptional regulator [Pseudooctadecabacter jejudonensis]|uniref:Helix-turn-helix domain protein n=1 Tax=Pseudooctadecabacter jejudonensis TaxID=1391910 RepID=A0A1Y5SRE0_9RHOB|nr:AraC family transcriptional regulator [Pseudooctadecabacter jejudonensis]SLN46034.1 Helix-turn-helix domain protein [Pseudooctadecabacter jejudonensis]
MQSIHFRNHLFAFQPGDLAMHENLMPCIILGRRAPVRVSGQTTDIEANAECIRPGVPHCVTVRDGGADIVYFDGLRLEGSNDFASLDGEWHGLPDAFKTADRVRITSFRNRLNGDTVPPDQSVMQLIRQIYDDPLRRMSQTDLAHAIGIERTLALRHFKDTTGQTFRKFKIWAAMVRATQLALRGEGIGNAGLAAGFSDASHLTRTAATVFGVTPTQGLSGLSGLISVEA